MAKISYLISGCLAGLCCRYDGESHPQFKCIDIVKQGEGIVACPEQLGGLAVPRTPSSIVGGDGFDVLDGKAEVLSEDGENRTRFFMKGAHEFLKILRLAGVGTVILKEKSPSCGVRKIYSGEDLVEGCGVTTALLLREGYQVLSSEQFE